jgi:N-acetylmuramoyl-L-alanine amidase
MIPKGCYQRILTKYRYIDNKSIAVLGLVFILLVSAPVFGKPWDSKGAAEHFKQAMKWQAALLREKPTPASRQSYLRVINEFEKVWLRDPHYSGCDDAMFFAAQLWKMAADSCKERQYLQKSVEQFQHLLREYPQSGFSLKAFQETIHIFCSQGLIDPAREQLQSMAKRFPKAKETQRGKQMVSALETQREAKALKVREAQKKQANPEPQVSQQASSEIQATAPAPVVVSVPPAAMAKEVEPLAPPEPALPVQSGEMTLTRTLGLKIAKVVLDPGHGGHDTGTISKSGLMEKDLVLDLALRLRRFLQERLGVEVILTRETDVFLSLEERTAIANKHKSDLFVSIHANSSRNQRINGVETFVLNWANNKEDQALAIRENASAASTVADLQDLVRKIAQNDKIGESRELAAYIQGNLVKTVSGFSPGAKDRGVKQAPFVVLIGAAMPSVLAEVSFLSNPKVALRLAEEDTREEIADGLCGGIERYVFSLSRQAGVTHRLSGAGQ